MTTNKQSKRTGKPDVEAFQEFLDTLDIGVRAKAHVNGVHHSGAVVTVDLGEPLEPVRLAADASQELVTRLRRLTRDLAGRECPVSISFDHSRGIYWSSIG